MINNTLIVRIRWCKACSRYHVGTTDPSPFLRRPSLQHVERMIHTVDVEGDFTKKFDLVGSRFNRSMRLLREI